MSFLFLIFLIVLSFVVWPLIKAAVFYRRIKNSFRKAQNSGGFRYNDNRTSHHRANKKIIDADVGEYVSFEEINVSETSYTETISSTDNNIPPTENQVSDAEWEDL